MIADHQMRTLTLWHHALMIDATVPGGKGFASLYRGVLHGEQARLVDQFEEDRINGADELAKLHEAAEKL